MYANCSGTRLYLLEFMANTGETVPLTWYTYLIYSTELVLLLFNVIFALVVVILLLRIKVWHFNLNCLIITFILVQIPAHFGRFVYMYHEIIVGIQNGDCCPSIIIATIFQFFYISVICHACVLFCLERLIALYYIQDYEKKKRPWIPVIFIAVLVLASVDFTYDHLFHISRISHYALYIFVLAITTTTLVYLMYLWNRKLLRRLVVCSVASDYTLSKKFQLMENIKVIKLCKLMVVAFTGLILLICVIIFHLLLYGWTPLGVMLFELTKSSCPTVVMLTAVFSIKELKKTFLRWINVSPTERGTKLSKEDDTQAYFEQLNDLWK